MSLWISLTDQDVARGMEPGADDYIVKPPMEYHFLGRIAHFAKKT